jgi:hypothetical protein
VPEYISGDRLSLAEIKSEHTDGVIRRAFELRDGRCNLIDARFRPCETGVDIVISDCSEQL